MNRQQPSRSTGTESQGLRFVEVGIEFHAMTNHAHAREQENNAGEQK